YILVIKLTRINSTALTLTQGNYTQSILETFGMADCRTTDTPMAVNARLVKCTDEDHLAFLQLGINYREALGLLNYLAQCVLKHWAEGNIKKYQGSEHSRAMKEGGCGVMIIKVAS
ncbi:uncharacterized protein VP01_7190g1, partial [Puccinia sorghi]